MSGSFKILKKETRILGLDNCNPHVGIGAVVRGGFYLDGVVSLSSKFDTQSLAREIKDTKYFPELRLIMVHDPKTEWNYQIIHRVTKLPVIRIRSTGSIHAREEREEEKRRWDWDAIGLDRSMLTRVGALTEVKDGLPEPVRIAHLLAKLHIFGELRGDKG